MEGPLTAVLLVLMVNVAEVRPAVIVAFEGTVTPLVVFVSAITMPPVGAAPLIFTVPVADLPLANFAGAMVTLINNGGFTVKVLDAETDPDVPVMVAVVTAATAIVLTLNVALVFPEATKTVAGTADDLLLLASFTESPALFAGPVRVTVPTDAVPPVTELGAKSIDLTTGATMVSDAAFVMEPMVATTTTTVCFVT